MMLQNGVTPLTLMRPKQKLKADSLIGNVLRGADALPFAEHGVAHAVHKQALFAIISELNRFPVAWRKGEKFAPVSLTPLWVGPFIQDVVTSLTVMGYVAYKQVKDQLIIAPVCTLDVEWDGVNWILTKDTKSDWNLIMHSPPIQVRSAPPRYSSPAAMAFTDTEKYDELIANYLHRDHYNSRPSVFATIDGKLQNQPGQTHQWFQGMTSGDAAAMRTVDVDISYQTLIKQRADTIKRLGAETALERERLNQPIKNDAKRQRFVTKQNMDHLEHVVTDGKTITTTKHLNSLQDGMHLVDKMTFQILWCYQVVPPALGINPNAERTAINPRLIETILNMFTNSVRRVRSIIQLMFDTLSIENAMLAFIPTVSKADLERLGGVLDGARVASLYASAYDIPEEFFNPAAFRNLEGAQLDSSKIRKPNRTESTREL
jgi:hypothetical protein